ncbi:preprotein translocase subunit SecE [Thermodesulfobacteriota bacterium]
MGRLKRKKSSGQKKSSATATDKVLLSESAKADTPETGPAKKSAGTESKAKKLVPIRKPSKPVKAVSGKKEPNIIDKSLQFLREVKVELKKVTWPSRKQTIGSTVVVVILAMIISLFLGVVDMGLSGLIRVILN